MTVQNIKKGLADVRQGFTLIELLIVMAILGVLAVVVLVAINPVQQLARTRDAGRKSGVAQLGRSLEAYYTAHGGSYVVGTGNSWVSLLGKAGEISTVPSLISSGLSTYTACTEGAESGWCYEVSGGLDAAIAYTVLESASETSKCTAGVPIFVWSTTLGRGGLVCNSDENLDIADIDDSSEWNATQ